MRSRTVQVDTQQLTRARQGKALLKLNLFDDTALQVRVQQTRRTPQGYYLQGEVEGQDSTNVSLMVNGGLMTGEVSTPRGHYVIRPKGFGRHVVSQLDPMAREVSHQHHEHGDAIGSSSRALPSSSTTLRTHDLLILYTASAEGHYGGRAAMEMEARRWVADTNTVLGDGGLSHRFRVLAIRKVEYNEHSGSGKIVDQGIQFGQSKDWRLLQNQYAADSILVAFGRAFDSRGIVVPAGAFVDSRAGSTVVAHELGHILGAAHDRYELIKTSGQSELHGYNFGYVNLSRRWRTLMSYNTKCLDNGTSCRQLMRFSNPDQYLEGHRLGVPRNVSRTDENGPADAITAIRDQWNYLATQREFCSSGEYTVSSLKFLAPTGGGKFFVDVDAPGHCVWEARSRYATVSTVNSAQHNNGPGRVIFTIHPNSGAVLEDALEIAGRKIGVRIADRSGGICSRGSAVQTAILKALQIDQALCDSVTLEQLGQVEMLDLSGLGLSSLQTADLAGLTALKNLRLANNQLTSLPSGLLARTPSLEEFNLGNNQLTSLPSGLLARTPSLEEFNLGNNQLTSLPSGLFARTPSLEELNLGSNQLTSLPSGLFVGLSRLSILQLAGNPGAPFPLQVSLAPAGSGRVKLVMPSGAPTDIRFHVRIQNVFDKDGNGNLSEVGHIPAGASEKMLVGSFGRQSGRGVPMASIESVSSHLLAEERFPGTGFDFKKHNGYSLAKGPEIKIPSGKVRITPLDIEVWTKDNPGTQADEHKARYQVVLDSKPANNVTIQSLSKDAYSIGLSTLSVTFTPENWDTAQSVTVTGKDDGKAEPGSERAIEIHNSTLLSQDPGYAGLPVDPVTVTLRKPDNPGVTIAPRLLEIRERDDSGTQVDERKAEYEVALDAWPTQNLVIALTSEDDDAVSVSPSKLTFTQQDWESPQTVTVTGADDGAINAGGQRDIQIAHQIENAGSGYQNVVIDPVTVRLADDADPRSVVTIAPGVSPVTEGTDAVFTVSAAPAPQADLTVDLTVADAANADFVDAGDEGAQTVTILANRTSADYAVATVGGDGETDDEPNGPVTVTVAASPDYTVGDSGAASITVNDDDATTVTLTGAAGDVTEGGTKDFTVSIGRGLYDGENLSAPLTFAGAATRGADYTTTCATVTGVACTNLDSGSAAVAFTGPSTGATATSVTLTLTADADSAAEGSETVDIGAGAPTATGLGGGAGTPLDDLAQFMIDDPAPTAGVTVSRSLLAVSEGDAARVTASYTVVLDNDPGEGVTVTVTPESADSGAASVSPASLSFTGGDSGNWGTAQPVTVTAVEDQDASNESFNITHGVTAPPGNDYENVVVGHVAVTVTDAGHGLIVSPGALNVRENGGTATYTVRLKSAPGGVLSVTPVSEDTSKATVSGALSFGNNSWDRPQSVTVTGKGSATGTVTISNEVTAATNAYPTTMKVDVAVTLTADPRSVVTIAPGVSPVTEGTDAVFTVSAAPAPQADLTVDLTVADAANADFVDAGDEGAQTVTILANRTSADYAVATVGGDGETDDEPNGPVTVTVAASPDYTVGDSGAASITVNDDDIEPTVSIAEASAVVEGDDPAKTIDMTFAVTLSRESGKPVTVPYTLGGTATAGKDYAATSGSVAIEAGASAAHIVIPVQGDGIYEGDETVTVSLGTPAGASVSTAESAGVGSGVITDDDEAPSFQFSGFNYRFNEDDGLVSAVIQRSGRTERTATLTILVEAGGAPPHAGLSADYTVSGDPLSFPPDQERVAFEINLIDDELAEAEETFYMSLVDPIEHGGRGDGRTSVFVRIIDNDQPVATLQPTGDVRLTEGDVNSFAQVKLGFDRRVGSGGVIEVPLSLQSTTGTAIAETSEENRDFVLSASGDGVSLAESNTAAPRVRFTGSSSTHVQEATLTFTATARDDGDLDDDELTVALGDLGSVDLGDTDLGDNAPTSQPPVAESDGETGNTATLVLEDAGETPTVTLLLTPSEIDESGADNQSVVTARLSAVSSEAVTLTVAAGPNIALSENKTLVIEAGATESSGEVTLTAFHNHVDADDAVIAVSASVEGETRIADPSSEKLTVRDDDTRGVTISESSLTVVMEDDRSAAKEHTATYTIRLDSEPTGPITIDLESSDTTIAAVSPVNLSFDYSNWSYLQTVTVTGIGGSAVEDEVGARTATITHTLSASGSDYASGVNVPDVIVTLAAGEPSNAVPNLPHARRWWNYLGGNRRTRALFGDQATDHERQMSVQQYKSLSNPYKRQVNSLANKLLGPGFDSVGAWWNQLSCRRRNQALGINNVATQGSRFCRQDYPGTPDAEEILEGSGLDRVRNAGMALLGRDDPGEFPPSSGHAEGRGDPVLQPHSAGTLRFSAAPLRFAEGTSSSYLVALASRPTGKALVRLELAGDKDITTVDTELRFTPENWDSPQTVTVSGAEDADAENDIASIEHVLRVDGNEETDPALLEVEVADTDTASTQIALSLDPSVIGEGGGVSQLAITATLDSAVRTTDTIVAVSIGSAGGSASQGLDYSAQRRIELTIPAHETSGAAVMWFTAVDDTVHETSEKLTVAGAAEDLKVMPATLTIADNDATAPDYDATNTLVESRTRSSQRVLAGFGRTLGVNVVDMVEERILGGNFGMGTSYASLGGRFVDLSALGLGGTEGDGPSAWTQTALDVLGLNVENPWELVSATGLPYGQFSLDFLPDMRDLASGSSFEIGLGGGDFPTWTVWGRGDITLFDDRLEHGFSMDGEVRQSHMGVDFRRGENLLAGALLGRSRADVNYHLPGERAGVAELRMTGLYPYAHWSWTNGIGVWGALGFGSGEVRLQDDAGLGAAPVDMRMTAVGVRRQLANWGAVDIAVKADAFLMRLQAQEGDGIMGAQSDVSRLRLAVQSGRSFQFGETSLLSGMLELGAFTDGNAGAGAELAAGIEYTHALGVQIQTQGHVLVSGGENRFRQWGASVAMGFDRDEVGEGLHFMVAPTWGVASVGAEGLWNGAAVLDGLGALTQNADAEMALEARIGYGASLRNGAGLLTPFGEYRMFDASPPRVGLGLELEGRGREPDSLAPHYELYLERAGAQPGLPAHYGITLTARGEF